MRKRLNLLRVRVLGRISSLKTRRSRYRTIWGGSIGGKWLNVEENLLRRLGIKRGIREIRFRLRSIHASKKGRIPDDSFEDREDIFDDDGPLIYRVHQSML
jgi:hypothetical protein